MTNPSNKKKESLEELKYELSVLKRKYGVSLLNKVWFEVYRAKKTWFTSPKWELYGKTYKLITEPTGEELAREMKVLN